MVGGPRSDAGAVGGLADPLLQLAIYLGAVPHSAGRCFSLRAGPLRGDEGSRRLANKIY